MTRNRFSYVFPVLFVLFSFALVFDTSQNMKRAQTFLTLEHNQELYERVKYWVESAACARKTGILLIVCGPNNTVAPIENFSLADDRGQALLGGLYAKLTARLPGYAAFTKLNLLMNAVGTLLLACVFWSLGLRVMALGTLAVAMAKVIPGPIPGPDATAGYIGMTCLAIVPALVWAGHWIRGWKRPALVFALAAAGAGLVSILRQPIGYQGVVLYFLVWALLLRWPKQGKPRAALMGLGFGVGITILTIGSSPALLVGRHMIWGIPVSSQTASHGISQSLFHGLGTEPNPWGIQWSDAYGLLMMRTLHPDKPYLSKDYIEILRHTYWDIVFHEPRVVLRIYLQKLWHLNELPLRWFGQNFYFMATLVLLGLLIAFFFTTGEARIPLFVGLVLALACAVMVLQAVLAVPWYRHLYPIKYFAIVMSTSLIEWALPRARSHMSSIIEIGR